MFNHFNPIESFYIQLQNMSSLTPIHHRAKLVPGELMAEKKNKSHRKKSSNGSSSRSKSPLQRLALDIANPALFECISQDSIFMRHLGEQFASALADGKIETALAMLAGCPALARLPCKKALFSALHWSCASVALAPATRALLLLGCDPLGYPGEYPNDVERASNTPLRWAISSGNLPSLSALLAAGAKPDINDLYEACRNAEGACAIAIMTAAPHLNPFEPTGQAGLNCHQALIDAAESTRNPFNESRLLIDEALSDFESWALERALVGDGDAGNGRQTRRL